MSHISQLVKLQHEERTREEVDVYTVLAQPPDGGARVDVGRAHHDLRETSEAWSVDLEPPGGEASAHSAVTRQELLGCVVSALARDWPMDWRQRAGERGVAAEPPLPAASPPVSGQGAPALGRGFDAPAVQR